MKLRNASLTDAHAIAEIHTNSWRNTYQETLTAAYLADVVPQDRINVWLDRLSNPKPNQYVLVAEIDGIIAGFACVYFDGSEKWGSYLDNLHVRKEYQSTGIGKALLLKLGSWCYQQNSTKGLCLLVNQTNSNAQGFYQSLGAHNAEAGVWNAPDGSTVPTYWFVWKDLSYLNKLSE